jgi:hypothetical protein
MYLREGVVKGGKGKVAAFTDGPVGELLQGNWLQDP